jgi:hypothetical protein
MEEVRASSPPIQSFLAPSKKDPSPSASIIIRTGKNEESNIIQPMIV